MKLIRSLFLVLFPLYFISCGTQQKIPNYLQQVSDSTAPKEIKVPELKIQKNDVLGIQVYSSSTKREVSDVIYNLPSAPSGAASSESATSMSGFLVDVNGNIEYPQIGQMKVEGLTRLQLADLIKTKINEKDSVLTNPSVIVRFQNFKITVLGEVNKQGVIQIPGERLTILEAIGLAGGINDLGLKQSVKIVRETDGKREVGYVDLSSNELFSSPYYLLAQNDMVLVDPSKRKAKKADQETFFRQAGFIISIITAIAVVIRVFQ